MTFFEILILAIIQGITEFLPISSSGHLLLPSALLGWESQGLAFDVAVHVGSLVAVMLYFRNDILNMLHAWLTQGFSKQQSHDSRLAWFVIIGTIPAVIIGFAMKDLIELYARTPLVIAATTIGFGLLLWFADARSSRHLSLDTLTLKQTLWIGMAQVLAIVPGTSRSGITMTAGLMLGLDRESCARFSFLLSIPVILGAGALSVYDLLEEAASIDWAVLGYGALFSFVSAYLCIYLFLGWISRIGMFPFVVYRLILGVGLLVFVLV